MVVGLSAHTVTVGAKGEKTVLIGFSLDGIIEQEHLVKVGLHAVYRLVLDFWCVIAKNFKFDVLKKPRLNFFPQSENL